MRTTEEYVLTLPKWQVKKLLADITNVMEKYTVYIKPVIKYKLLVAEVHIKVTGDANQLKAFESWMEQFGAIHT